MKESDKWETAANNIENEFKAKINFIFTAFTIFMVLAFAFLYVDFKKTEKSILETMPTIKTVEDCERYWKRAIEYEHRMTPGHYSNAINSATEILLYQSCLQRFK